MKIKKVYLGRKQIYPELPWRPGQNTVAYFPFKYDAVDYSGNNYTLSDQGTQDTMGRLFTTSVNLNANIPQTQNGTISAWVNIKSANSGVIQLFTYPPINGGQCLNAYNYHHPGENIYWQYYVGSNEMRVHLFNTYNTWHYICVSKNGSSEIIYCDGTKMADLSGVNFRAADQGNVLVNATTSCQVVVSEVIYENIPWTEQEISDYYNKTKAEYGIQ